MVKEKEEEKRMAEERKSRKRNFAGGGGAETDQLTILCKNVEARGRFAVKEA